MVDEVPNFKLLRDIGYQYAKGQLEKVPPVDGALDEMFARALYQANEYNQIFESTINYLDPIQHGFEECKGGLKPRLNKNANTDGPEIVMSQVNPLLVEDVGVEENCDCSQFCDEEVFDEDIGLQNFDSSVDLFRNATALDVTADNIFNITLDQNYQTFEDEIVLSDRQLSVESSEDNSMLFDFSEWLQTRRI